MSQSNSDNDVSMSPTQILERLQMLRQLQLMQRGKLQKQRLHYQETSESSCITEMISHFTNSINSTSYHTFQSLLQSSQNVSVESSPRIDTSFISPKVQDKDLIDGVSVLNLSQESEFVLKTPTSGRTSTQSDSGQQTSGNSMSVPSNSMQQNVIKKKHIISVDDMPILSPKKDFESLILEKLQHEKTDAKTINPKKDNVIVPKKTFLKRGEGMTRFGLNKNNLVIQNTKALPWIKKKVGSKPLQSFNKKPKPKNTDEDNLNKIVVPPLKLNVKRKDEPKPMEIQPDNTTNTNESTMPPVANTNKISVDNYPTSNCSIHSENKIPDKIIQYPKGKHPILSTKGKTWASVLNKEQSDFLMQLKQSDYYKNFASPAKSTVSDASYDENCLNLRQEKESAEQNLFELLENKVSQESFNLENSFFHRFLKRNDLESSGESTPLILQKCLASNPNLMHIFPDINNQRKSCHEETCPSDYTDCCSDASSTVSSCCSCKTVEPATPITCNKGKINKQEINIRNKEVLTECKQNDKKCQSEVDKDNEAMKANMVEMNEKLINTSELLKERLKELEDEIETFRKENINLKKLKEDVDLERQKFYEDKKSFEQKFNEEKILSEYYLAEEKEKLNKQKLMYERYVRDMRGRLNKKEKDEVVNLKQEISSLRDEIRIKDAKSTSTIARLRNQIKILDKEKTQLQEEVEKLKKENRRIQHSNDITRRLTNMKYLEQINNKLSKMNKETQSAVELNSDTKYKAFEIERQSRSRKAQSLKNVNFTATRPRAKSVPNLKVTSRYAKYFSQRDTVSHMDQNTTLINEKTDAHTSDSDTDNLGDYNEIQNIDMNTDEDDIIVENHSTSENNLEKIYMETFRSTSPKPKSNRSSNNNYLLSEDNSANSSNGFFLRKSNSSSSTRDSKSPDICIVNRSKSPVSVVSHRSSHRSPAMSHISANLTDSNNSYGSKSPISDSNNSSRKPITIIHRDIYQDKHTADDPEPSGSKLVGTNLNPTEIRKPDGSRELRYPNGNMKHISADGKYSKFVYYNGDVKENFYNEGTIKYFYAESKTCHTTYSDGLEVLEFPDGQIEKRYKDGSSEIRLPNGSVRYHDHKNKYVKEEWRFPNGSALTVFANGEKRISFSNRQYEVHSDDHKRRVYPDGTVKLVYKDGTSETRYASGRVRIRDDQGNLIIDSNAKLY